MLYRVITTHTSFLSVELDPQSSDFPTEYHETLTLSHSNTLTLAHLKTNINVLIMLVISELKWKKRFALSYLSLLKWTKVPL